MAMAIPIAQVLHLLIYVGIMWYGWQSYKTLRKQSWTYLGMGFAVLTLYRLWKLLEHLAPELFPINKAVDTIWPLIGAALSLVAFYFMRKEDLNLIKRLRLFRPSKKGEEVMQTEQKKDDDNEQSGPSNTTTGGSGDEPSEGNGDDRQGVGVPIGSGKEGDAGGGG